MSTPACVGGDPGISPGDRSNSRDHNSKKCIFRFFDITLKGLSHEIDFINVVENGQILALIRAAAGF